MAVCAKQRQILDFGFVALRQCVNRLRMMNINDPFGKWPISQFEFKPACFTCQSAIFLHGSSFGSINEFSTSLPVPEGTGL